jgi:hypothetical protein
MKTIPNYPHPPEHDTASLIRSLIVSAIMLAILLAFTGCTAPVPRATIVTSSK